MTTASPRGWRTTDIVVSAALAVAFGVVFWAWGIIWEGFEAATAFYPPARALIYGVWLLPATLAPLVIRKPGAGVITETIAATVSMLLGSQWGIINVGQGFAEGLAGEAPFALGGYRRWGIPTSVFSGALAGFTATVIDCFVWYPTLGLWTFQAPFVALATLSSALIAGLGAPALVKALAGTGALDQFPSGRDRKTV